MVAADSQTAISFSLSLCQANEAIHGQMLPGQPGCLAYPLALIMVRAYEDSQTRQLGLDLGFVPVVPPRSNRISAWEYDRIMYRKRNVIERLFCRLKGFRRIFSRFDKLDVMFAAFILFVLIVETFRCS